MKKNNQNGYTLIEILVAIQIFAVVLTMAYTIYLYSIKFMGRWEQNNDLVSTQVILERALDSKFNALKRISEIADSSMLIDCGNNRLERLEWADKSFMINDKKPAVQDEILQLKSLKYQRLKNNTIQSVTFSELDKNGDKKLSGDELRDLKAIEISLSIIGKKMSADFHYFKSLNFPPL